MHEKIYFAFVGVKPLEGNQLTPNAEGAYVRVAFKLISENPEDYLKEAFKKYDYSVFEIEDVKLIESMSVDELLNPVSQQLLVKLDEGDRFVWGTFHTW